MTANEYTKQVQRALGIRTHNSREAKRDAETSMAIIASMTKWHSLDYEVQNAFSGLRWSVYTGRLQAAYSLTLRDMNAYQLTKLLGAIAASCHTNKDVLDWLRKNTAFFRCLVPNNHWEFF